MRNFIEVFLRCSIVILFAGWGLRAGAFPDGQADDVTSALGMYKPITAPTRGFDPYSYANPLWLDDRYVLVGMRPLKAGEVDDKNKDSYGSHWIVMWDTETNTISAPLVEGRPYCVNATTKYVQVEVKKDKVGTTFKHGIWGSDMEAYLLADFNDKSKKRYINPYSCRDYLGNGYKLISNQVTFPVREDHGILHFDIFEKVAYTGPFVVRFSTPAGETTEFEITSIEWNTSTRSYSPFTQSYLFVGKLYRKGAESKNNIEKNKEQQHGYSLFSPFPPHEIKFLPLPAKLREFSQNKIAGDVLFPSFLSNKQILWHYLITERTERGTYLQQEDRLIKILDGHQTGPKISPNGCKLVYVFNSGRYFSSNHNPRESNRLEFINFCNGK